MYKNNNILAIIPARGGSKGIKNKNIIDLNGKPLIQYTIEAALGSKYIDKILVSTDSEQIAEVSISLGAEVPFLRSKELAGDKAKTIDVLVDVVNKLRDKGEIYQYLILLQPTSPLRNSRHIDEALEKLIASGEKGLVSVHEVIDHPVLIREISEDEKLENLINQGSTIRRQDFKKYYKVNGAIYINKLDDLFDERLSLNDNKCPYIMERKCSVDIDEKLDLIYAEKILENK